MDTKASSAGNIIIANDDPTTLLLLRHILVSSNYDITEARSGHEIIELCRDYPYDLAILDLVMPGMDALAVCRELTFQISMPPPILIITSLDDDLSLNAAFEVGATDYITHPINWSVFRHRVKRIVQAEKNHKSLRQLQFHDTLTGLPNRALLLDRLESAILRSQRNQSILALMMVDIDNFKLINESLGHEHGDQIILSVARRLEQSIRDTDTLSRIGADEFNMIIENISRAEDVGLMANKFCRAIEHTLTILDQDIHIDASIGISVFPQDGTDSSTLLSHADAALQRAKEQGGHVCEFYSPALGRKVNRRLSLENNLRNALRNDELIVYYQPKVDLKTGVASGIEALVRWAHPGQGLISPDEFIPIAEETSMIIPLGQRVIEQACRQFSLWQQQNFPVNNISINVSARQFKEQDLVGLLNENLQEYNLDPRCIELELTESTLLKHEQEASKKLDRLHNMGLKISIDDFGTGYASLSYLKRLPIDVLKIDRSFTDGVLHDPDDITIIHAINGLGKGLGLKLVAEGIETNAQLGKFTELGVDYGQGYLWSPPCSADDYTRLLCRDANLIVQ